jgi:hypothetical protein
MGLFFVNINMRSFKEYYRQYVCESLDNEDSNIKCENILKSIDDGVIEETAISEPLREKITKITIPDNIKVIGKNSFKLARKLSTIVIPKTVTEIGVFAFGYTNLSNVAIPDSVKTIGSFAFHTTNLTEVSIGNGVTEIHENAFSGCPHLKTVTFGDNLKKLDDYAFAKCNELEEITLPKTLETIGKGVLMECPKLKTITIYEESPIYHQYNEIEKWAEQIKVIPKGEKPKEKQRLATAADWGKRR